MRKPYGFLTIIMVVFGFAGCGGGDDNPPPAPPPHSAVVQSPNLTITQEGSLQTVTAGDAVVVIRATVTCPQTGALCTMPALVGSVNFSSTIALDNLKVLHNGQEVLGAFVKTADKYSLTPIHPWNFGGPGTIEIRGVVSATATGGQSTTITLSASGAGGTVITLAGSPSIIAVTKSLTQAAVTLANLTPTAFTRSGYGKLGSFDMTCPKDVGNCTLKEVVQVLTSTVLANRTQIDTFVGSLWWYQQETTDASTQTFTLNSPTLILAGETVTVEVRANIASGTLIFKGVVLTDKTGKVLPLSLPPREQVCGTVLAPLAFPPC
jgi:hypothetical protein